VDSVGFAKGVSFVVLPRGGISPEASAMLVRGSELAGDVDRLADCVERDASAIEVGIAEEEGCEDPVVRRAGLSIFE